MFGHRPWGSDPWVFADPPRFESDGASTGLATVTGVVCSANLATGSSAGLATVNGIAGVPSLDQTAYRWRNDDGSESAATWAAAINTALPAALSSNIQKRLRFLVQSVDGPAGVAPQLEVGVYYPEWTQQTSSFGTSAIWGVTHNGTNQYVAVGDSGKLATSPNGVTWTQRVSSFGTTAIRGVTHNGTDQYVAVGASGKIATSSNGTSWTLYPYGTSALYGVTYNGTNQYVLVGTSGIIATSSNGTSWNQQTSSFGTSAIWGVTHNGTNQYVAVGASGKLATSPNGVAWTQQTSSFGTSTIYGVTHNGTDQYVAVGFAGQLATSPDGVAWTQQTSSFGTSTIYGVTYNGTNQYVAVGSGKIATSPDGEVWTQQTSSFDTTSIWGVTYNGSNQYVAVGDAGKLAALGINYHDVTTISTLARAYDSANLTNGADTTQQLGAGTFIVDNNGVSEDGLAGTTTSAGGDEAEYEYTVEFIAADLSAGDELRFRIKAS